MPLPILRGRPISLMLRKFDESDLYLSNTVRTISLGIIGAGIVVPLTATEPKMSYMQWVWLIAGVAFHLYGDFALKLLQHEDRHD